MGEARPQHEGAVATVSDVECEGPQARAWRNATATNNVSAVFLSATH